MIYFYHFLSIFVAILLIPLFSLAALLSKYKWKKLAHHFGWIPKSPGKKTLLLHALSMGEVVATMPVLKHIRKQNPELYIALSVSTDSGYVAALKLNIADNVFFHPLDCLPFTQLALSRINPDLYVVIDTGFWPGWIDLLHKKNILIILFNGRISERSARRYLNFGSLFKNTFQKFHRLSMQNSNGEKAVLMLGVDKKRIEVVGEPKYDAQKLLTDEEKERLRKALKLEKDTPVWIAGSSHPGEEEIILDAHQLLIPKHPRLVLILAPRRIERVEEVIRLLKKKNIPFTLRSSVQHEKTVILLDTLGELAQVYSLGQVAFIGKSLIRPGGGHSMIEPLKYGLTVMHGPFIENIRHVTDKAHKLGLTLPVQNSEDIKERVQALLENESLRRELQEKARFFIAEQQGASKKMAQIITESLKTDLSA
jgi:3-deoxy-D-manno-octulosonic-acid transferase